LADLKATEVARHADDVDNNYSSIQLLQMPWSNMSSRPTSRQASQDPHPQSSILSGGGGFRSSVTRDGGFDDYSFEQSSTQHRRDASEVDGVYQNTFASQVETLEKESREFCEFFHLS
jgi:hypothetical protein